MPDGTAPPPDAVNTYQPTGCPGGRAPHLWLDDGRSLYDALGFEFTLLVLGDSFMRMYQTDDPTAAGFISHLARALRLPLTSIVNDGGALVCLRLPHGHGVSERPFPAEHSPRREPER